MRPACMIAVAPAEELADAQDAGSPKEEIIALLLQRGQEAGRPDPQSPRAHLGRYRVTKKCALRAEAEMESDKLGQLQAAVRKSVSDVVKDDPSRGIEKMERELIKFRDVYSIMEAQRRLRAEETETERSEQIGLT